MKSLNKVQLIGNLGKDPESKFTSGGKQVAQFSIATSSRYKDSQGEWQDRTEWHNITAWERLAEIAVEYLRKGSKVYIEGRLETQSWDDKQTGKKMYKTIIVAHDLILLDGRSADGDEHRGRSETRTDTRRQESDPQQSFPITDEDIPF